MRQDVADHVQLAACRVCLVNPPGQCVEVTKVVIAHAQTVARLARVHRIGTEGEGGAQHGQ